jgi:putative nucleotidyltransferase with HDIG domain
MSVEDGICERALRAGVTQKNLVRLLAAIAPLRDHNEAMYCHSLRVGVYAYEIAVDVGEDPKFAIHGGCAHDVGKCAVSNDVISSKNWTAHEREAMSVHPVEGFKMLKDSHLFSSFIAGLHHTFQDSPYGIDPETDIPEFLSDTSKTKIVSMARLVATADVFDALLTREPYHDVNEAIGILSVKGFPVPYVNTLRRKYGYGS